MPSTYSPAPTVIGGLVHALRPHAPFSAMDEGDVVRLVRAARLAYFAPGDTILAPGASRPDSCYVIKQGAVRGERPGAAGDAAGLWELSAGEMFPLGALLGRPRRDVGLSRGTGHVLPRVSRGGVRRAGGAVGAVPRLLHASARLPPRRAARRRAGGVSRRPDDAAGHEFAAVGPPALGARDGHAGCRASRRRCGRWRTAGSVRCPSSTRRGGPSGSSRGRTSSDASCFRSAASRRRSAT